MKKIITLCLIFSLLTTIYAQNNYVPAPENMKAREEFQDNKFGIFIHWGIYSMLGDGEWVMNNKSLNYKEYEKLAAGFYPANFDAAEWVANIKASGAKYICITSRHHDGFSMFDTKYSDYNIVKATPFKRDILKEIADECEKQGIKLHLYYSHIDWNRADYAPRIYTGLKNGHTEFGDFSTYYQFMNNQIKELLTNYGSIGAIWFDGVWDQEKNPDFDWRLPEQYAMIHQLRPACLIANNHHIKPFPGEDIQIFERDLPGENFGGLSGQDVSALPLETCETMNRTWGYRITDQHYKTTEQLIHLLVKAAGKNANLLLNVGPQPDGSLPAEAVSRMKEIGEWMNRFGETVYGTRGGPVTARDWGVTTQKENKIFVHILNLEDKVLFVPITGKKIKKATRFIDQSPLKFAQTPDGVIITLLEIPTAIDEVIELVY
ncbi:alpha-L-fucosidase [Bacteroidales bacterium OttesenSCG-928-B11]|nr:alpha-L-fucosidase [Bacteroidales bacterium OttesenSCG-928-E04]MDL2308455.1 alpha-L-fucosidase [Bacteroidales bacterium OttesenSCG-928-C03]MDL2311320.1 alpha-L-fucosidase [Bacteroidales bacterium OttesenSCG-928-B11]MDL2326046.1 alpha-L-fucosidase [Bacteroidales bacterium OttesenSCG-928-A14]